MTTIELVLPGEQRTTTVAFSRTYRITVERDDGVACSEMEARAAVDVFFFFKNPESKPRGTGGKQGAE